MDPHKLTPVSPAQRQDQLSIILELQPQQAMKVAPRNLYQMWTSTITLQLQSKVFSLPSSSSHHHKLCVSEKILTEKSARSHKSRLCYTGKSGYKLERRNCSEMEPKEAETNRQVCKFARLKPAFAEDLQDLVSTPALPTSAEASLLSGTICLAYLLGCSRQAGRARVLIAGV